MRCAVEEGSMLEELIQYGVVGLYYVAYYFCYGAGIVLVVLGVLGWLI